MKARLHQGLTAWPKNMAHLQGKRIVITRTGAQAEALAAALLALGAEPLVFPTIAIVPPLDQTPLDHAIRQLATYDWVIVSSANGARVLLEQAEALAVRETLHDRSLAAVGPATAAVLREHGLTVAVVPDEHVAEGLLAALGDVHGKRVLLPLADLARPILAEGLRQRGALVDAVVAYRTVAGPGGAMLVPLLQAQTVDAITFTSASTVRLLLAGMHEAGLNQQQALELIGPVALVCIGPITAGAVREAGLQVAAEATRYTADGLVAALLTYFGQQ